MKNILNFGLMIAVVVTTCFSYSCSSPSDMKSQAQEFDANRAIRYIEEQVAFGPRVPGSRAWANCKNYLIAYFDSLGYTVEQQNFMHVDYITGQTIPLTNLLANLKSSTKSEVAPILLCAHWDSRPRSERDPDPARRNDSLPAANDGASGVALLMELATIMKNTAPSVPVSFVLFDGEDWGREGDVNQYSLGAKRFAQNLSPKSYRYAILVDIIAHAGATFRKEQFSEQYASSLNDKVWTSAKELGITRFIDSVGQGVIDDHLPLLNVGLPTIDIIDMSYKYWHTTADTPDKCDSASLYDVGSVVARTVYKER